MKAKFISPVVTAFDCKYNLDIKANQKIWDFVIEGGVDGIILLGSTGEFFALSMEEKKDLIYAACKHINHRVPLIVGTGSMIQEETIILSKYAIEQGADGVIIVAPYYFSLTQDSLEDYFDTIANSVDGKIYLYNYPERTGYDLTADLMLRLRRKHDNIVGCKDTVVGFAHTRKLIETILPEFPDFEIYSGYDDNFAHNLLSGGSGVIGGLTNVAPEVGSGWVKAFDDNDLERISYYQKKMDILAQLFDIGVPFVPLVKKAMILRGIPMEEISTPPLQKPTIEQIERIKNILMEIES
ncbi:MAG: dihydrodipicolinate synthase family protein [Clostridiales bacterium]|jgi:4-hydroxy-tetrahydrodipicolinate synthase|nr:dihydrodipicolinate synthase family protein [Clostridiales bacterium]